MSKAPRTRSAARDTGNRSASSGAAWKRYVAGGALVLIVGGVAGAVTLGTDDAGPEIAVYKSPSCGCCAKWVDHLRDNGFTVTTHDVSDLREIKVRAGVPSALTACHTAIVEGYVVEGHVPADALRRFLRERPDAVGLAVAGMPMGTPGMEGPRKDPYNILTFDGQGRSTIFERR